LTSRTTVLAATVVVLAATGAACGASTSTKTVTVTRTRTVATKESAGGGSSSTGGSQAVSSTAPRCHTSQLGFTYATDGAAGTILINGTLANRSQTTCTLYGYPGLGLLDRHGAALPTTVLRSPGPVIPHVPEHVVMLAPGGKADFYASFSDVDPQPCPLAAKIEVTPPNAFRHLTADAGFTPCQGRIHVSPVFAPGG
jgi:hypothetical protein